MKKTFIYFFIAGALSFTSCTETFEPTVDYGDQTYINDYSSLVAAVNNLNKSLSERFEALNQLLNKNMAELKVAIDENTGAIKIVGDNVDSGLASINTTLFNGFSTLSTQIDETGKQIVYAMNENGELLRLEISKTGELISAQIKASADKLAETINNQTIALNERFDALTLVTKAGLADISVKIDNVDKTLDIQLGNVNSNLGTLNTTMFDGFKTLNTTITENGNTIVTAMNKNGELLRLEIDETGKLITAEIQKSQQALIDAINSQTTSLETKFDALHGMIEAGFANVTVQIGEVGTQLHLDIQGLDFGAISDQLSEGFTTLGTAIDANGEKIVTAINDQGDILEVIADNTEVISTNIKDFHDDYNTNEEAELAKLVEILEAIGTLNESIDKLDENQADRNKELIEKLNAILAKDQIYTSTKPGEEGEVLYMSPSKFQQIEEAGTESSIYKKYANQIQERKVTIDCVQVINETGFANGSETERPPVGSNGTNVHSHAAFNPNTGADTDAILVADPPQVEDFSNGIEVVRVIKTPVTRNYNVVIDTGTCAWDYIYKITTIDANGRKDKIYSPTYASTQSFVLTVYNGKEIVDKATAFVYCTKDNDKVTQ